MDSRDYELGGVLKFLDNVDDATVSLIADHIKTRAEREHHEYVLEQLYEGAPILVACNSLKYRIAVKNGYRVSAKSMARLTMYCAINDEGSQIGDVCINDYYMGNSGWLDISGLGTSDRDAIREATCDETEFVRLLEPGTVDDLQRQFEKCVSFVESEHRYGTVRCEVAVVIGPPDLDELESQWLHRVVPIDSPEFRAAAENDFIVTTTAPAELHVEHTLGENLYIDRWTNWDECGVTKAQMLEFVDACSVDSEWVRHITGDEGEFIDESSCSQRALGIIESGPIHSAKRARFE